MKISAATTVFLILIFSKPALLAQPEPDHNLRFDSLASRWDEAMPVGNGLLGALVWKKNDRLRLSLDRVDLWDDRPMPGIDQFTFRWVAEKVRLKQYDSVQKMGDEPYEKSPGPTKIPGAALEFDMAGFGKVISNELDIRTATNTIRFDNGGSFKTYVHAELPIGIFILEKLPETAIPQLVIPEYASDNQAVVGNSVDGQSLQRLGYASGTVSKTANTVRYYQPTYGKTYYEVLITWKKTSDSTVTGQWTISNNKIASPSPLDNNLIRKQWVTHLNWWKDFWSRSSISLPEAVLEKQYYLDTYKFGCVARNNTPPISLQAVWTADNGNLPPWKGDFHHDLNTQLSYWPGYSGNHVDLTEGFTNWLWKVKDENKRWTKHYFEVDGLNVPGVTTITGKPMGGWIQYSLSPTTVAWLSQHFYWQWKYSGDDNFLKEKCKPYFDEALKYFTGIRMKDSVTGLYRHALSSSPEYNNNDITAWFSDLTSYDLALVRFFMEKYAEVTEAATGSAPQDVINDLKNYPFFDTDTTGLTIAPGVALRHSHRHQSQLMAIYPLKLLNYSDTGHKTIIDHSLRWVEKNGTREWVGYTFPWLACLYAQTGNGDSAASALRKFPTNFVSKNSFHLNGDQKGGQYVDGTYRPFTLEGNFAFAQGIHELLLQSGNGHVKVFPAVPGDWKDVSFNTLRVEGGFLVSATMKNGVARTVTIRAERVGKIRIKLPSGKFEPEGMEKKYDIKDGFTELTMEAREQIDLVNKEN